MARLRLRDYEVEEEALPPVCMCCGADATTYIQKSFSWSPSWVIFLIFFGLLPWVIVALALTKRMTIEAPLCEEHRNHWSWRDKFMVLGILFFLLLGAVGVTVALVGEDYDLPEELGPVLLGATAVGLLLWLIAVAVLQSRAIKVVEITKRSITLSKLASAFVDAVKEDRTREDEEADRDDRVYRRPQR